MRVFNPVESERLLIRPLNGSDRQALYELIQSPDILVMLLRANEVFTEEWFQAYFERLLDNSNQERFRWAVISKANNSFVGVLSLVIEENDFHAEIGYWIGTAHRNEGFATEACRLLIKNCFEEQKLHRIFAFTYPYNQSSIRVLEKLQMRKEGLMREHVYLNGGFWDMILYGILSTEFE